MTIICGDCLEEMRKMKDNSISAIVTDPPYGLHFIGKDWDKFNKSNYNEKRDDEFQQFIREWASESLRIVKPGGHILMFGAPRRYHRQVCGLEDAGWEIRDCLMWIFGSGFPKSHNYFGIEGYGTALKPAYEPIIMAMKPCDGTFKQNAEKWGQAGINIEGCRIESDNALVRPFIKRGDNEIFGKRLGAGVQQKPKGRWPANVILDGEAGKILDGQQDKVSRFFYCAKTSFSERNEGLDDRIPERITDGCIRSNPETARIYQANSAPRKNPHPTVKPLKLMEYLIKLVMPPKDGILLDPFAGSGTTILAAHRLGLNAIGIEKQPEYVEIASARLAYAQRKENGQCDLFDSLVQ